MTNYVIKGGGIMQFRVLILLIFALLVTIFAVFNTHFVEINFLFGKTSIQLIFVLIFSLLIGALIMFILASMKQLKMSREIKGLKKEIRNLKVENERLVTTIANNETEENNLSVTESASNLDKIN